MYGQYFSAFARAGCSVFAYSRKGFGKSEGRRGRVGSHIVEECLDFIYLVVRERKLEKVKKYLYGVSMGGLLAARVAIENTDFFDGIILTVPWFESLESQGINQVKKLAVRSASYLLPGLTLLPPKGSV